MMFCARCGKQLPEAAKFCSGCGYAVTASTLAAHQPPPPPPIVVPRKPPAGTRDQPIRTDLIYASNPPQSPFLCCVNFLVPGLAQMIFGQVAKGFLILAAAVGAGALTLGVGYIAVLLMSVVDAFKVGRSLKAGRPVSRWEFFPESYGGRCG